MTENRIIKVVVSLKIDRRKSDRFFLGVSSRKNNF
jgi:hypothetical protein